MANRDYIDFQNRTQPLAFLITFRCYGTWLHEEERGSVDRRNYNRYGTAGMPANKKIFDEERIAVKGSPVRLTSAQRRIVELAISEVCHHRKYLLHAVNARSNHVHSVVSASCGPERVMNSFKAYATRKLREANLVDKDINVWARHGSTPYLWTEEDVRGAID